MDDVIKLILFTTQQNEYGVVEETAYEKEIFCKVDSVTRQEFFEGGRNGLNPSFVFTIFTGDYNEDCVIEYKGNRYGVYRTYTVPGTDYMELYAERKGGVIKGDC